MDGLALKVIWKDQQDNMRQEWAVLGKDQSISIERSNPIFNESGTFSYPFSLPYEQNKYIFGEIKLPESEKRIADVNYKFELYCQGLFLLMGDLDISEGEIEETIDLQLRSGNNLFWKNIEGINCRQVNQAKEVIVGNIVKSVGVGGRFTYHIEPVYNVNLAYPNSNFCNVRIIMNPIMDTDDEGNEIIRTPILEPSSNYAGICFYVLYLIECVFKMINIHITVNDMLNYEDFKRLAFFVTTRATQQDGVRKKVYATSDNFPNKPVSEVIESLKSAFGIVFIHDEYSNKVQIKLIKNILTGNEYSKLSGNIINASKINSNYTNLILKYDADSNDTAFNYNDYDNIIVINDYNSIVELYSNDKLRDDDIFCYIDAKTGNAYRVKVDNETNTDPTIFEVGQFNEYVLKKGNINNNQTEEIVIRFTPVIINDITLEDVRKKANYVIESAIYVNHNLEITTASFSTTGRRSTSSNSYTRTSTTADRVPQYTNRRKRYLYSDINKYDTGFVLGIMRGPGGNEKIDSSISDYRNEIGGNSFVKLAGSMSFTSDSIDVFGRDYDYNGAAGGVGVDPLKDRFSLKLRATKPGYTASVYPDRGLVDTFLSEYLHFLQNRRTVKIQAEIPLAELVAIDWEKKYHIGEYLGFINKLSFSLDNNGISNTEIELYMI